MIELSRGAEAKFGCVESHVQASEPLVRDGRRNRRIEGVGAIHRTMNPECNRRCAPVGLVAEVIFRAHGSVGDGGQQLRNALHTVLNVDSVRGVKENSSPARVEREQCSNQDGVDLDALSAWRRKRRENDMHGLAPIWSHQSRPLDVEVPAIRRW